MPTRVFNKIQAAESGRGILDNKAVSKTLLMLRHIVDVAAATIVR